MVVLITGAAHRIGREISLTLARKGHPIAIHYMKSMEGALQLEKEINSMGKGKATVHYADTTDLDSLRSLIGDVASVGVIEHIVNNASSFEHDNISTVTSESFDSMIAVNLKAPLFLSKEFISYRNNILSSSASETSHPSITNILDMKIASTNADYLSYTIAKHGLHSLTEMLAKDSAPRLRGLNAVAPGPILAASNQCGKSFQKSQERFPLAYNPSPRDVADAVSFLLTAKAITGQTIYVDSGDRFYCKLVDGIEVE